MTTPSKSTPKSKTISLVFLFPMLIRATIFHSVLVVIHSFQLNNNCKVVLPRNFRHVDSVLSTATTTLPFTFNDNSSCGQSILENQRYFKNNKNSLIRLYSTLQDDNNNKELLSLSKKETKDKTKKKNKEKKSTSTQRKEPIASKTIIDEKKTVTGNELKQEQSRRSWEDSFELLKQYKEEWGDCLVPQNYNPDKRLGRWVDTQRQQAKKGKLKTEQKEKLDQIGFSWDAKVDNWNYMMEQLKEFQEEFGHCDVELNKYKSRQTLAYWVKKQRESRPLLTNEQRSQLEELGFVWKDVGKARGDRQWEERFKALQDYQRVYGDTRVPFNSSHNNNVKLGKWVSLQRRNYKKGILRKDREDKLNSIGFIWKLRDLNTTDYEKLNKIWMKNLEKLKNFKTIHNHTNVPQRYEKDPKLGTWVRNQRNCYRLGTLKKIRQEMLESIGFEWSPKEKAFEEQWMDFYQDLVMFQNKHGHVDVSSRSHKNLYEWLLRQRTLFANNKLESDRKELLEKLGVDLNTGPGSGSIMQD